MRRRHADLSDRQLCRLIELCGDELRDLEAEYDRRLAERARQRRAQMRLVVGGRS